MAHSNCILLLLVVLLPDIGMAQQTAQSGARTYTIDGREHPEFIPAELAWETAFNALWNSSTYPDKSQPTDEVIKDLSQYALRIPPSEVKVVLRVAKHTLDRVKELRGPFDREHTSGVDLRMTAEQRRSRLAQINETIIDGRDELACTLKPSSFKALKRWILRVIVPGVKVDIYDKPSHSPESTR